MKDRIDIEEAARRLAVSPDFIRQMIAKGRLRPHHDDHLDAEEVAKLGHLMERLRGAGMAAMVNVTDDGRNPLD